jgi:hypothetical protein
MAFGRAVCGAVMALGLACAMTPAHACQGAGCPVAKPLDLTRFMKPSARPAPRALKVASPKSVAKISGPKLAAAKTIAAPVKRHAADRRAVVIAHHRKPAAAAQVATIQPQPANVPGLLPSTPPMPPLPPTAATMPAEAATAYAAAPPVDVVPRDALNELDRAASPSPGSASLNAATVQFVEAQDYNDIDRQADDALPASFAEPARPASDQPNTTPQRSAANLSWGERLWTMLQHVASAIVSGWRNLFG